MGLGMQLVAWPNSFCEGLAARGFRVIRFDNRDAGLSSRIRSAGRLATRVMMARALLRLPVRPPYTLNDMAADTVGLLDELGIAKAHVVGASMGGMIAQIVAIEHPERVKSLTSIMSSPAPVLPRPKVLRALLRPPPQDEERAIRRMMEFFRLVGGAGYPPTEAELQARVGRSVRRSHRPDGLARQLIAIQTAPSSRANAPSRRGAHAGAAWDRRSVGPEGRGRANRRQHPGRPVAHDPRDGPFSAGSARPASCRRNC